VNVRSPWQQALRRPGPELALLVAMVVTLVPIVWVVVTGLNAPRDIISPDWDFTLGLHNVRTLFGPDSVVTRQILNSILITLATVVICLFVAAVAGYSLSQLAWSRRTTIALLGSAGLLQLVPPMALVPGLYITLQSLGLINSVAGLILLNVVFNLPFAAVMMKIYFDAVPAEIREAGVVDGAGEWRIFRALQVPLVAPGLAAVGVFVAIQAWNEFLFGLTLTTGGPTAPVTVGIAGLVQPQEIQFGPMAAIGSITAIPIILLAVLANRQIVAGLTGGAVK